MRQVFRCTFVQFLEIFRAQLNFIELIYITFCERKRDEDEFDDLFGLILRFFIAVLRISFKIQTKFLNFKYYFNQSKKQLLWFSKMSYRKYFLWLITSANLAKKNQPTKYKRRFTAKSWIIKMHLFPFVFFGIQIRKSRDNLNKSCKKMKK